MPQGGTQGPNLGHFFKESFIIEQQLLFPANFIFDISDLRAHAPGRDRR